MNYKVAVIKGDGIGPEIVTEAQRCLIKQERSLDLPFLMKMC